MISTIPLTGVLRWRGHCKGNIPFELLLILILPVTNISIDGMPLENVDQSTYLGRILSKTPMCEDDMNFIVVAVSPLLYA